MLQLNDEQKKIVENNLGLVYFVLKKAGITRNHKNYEDLFGAGCLGLCNAVRAWDSNKSPFSTFAYYVIRHEVMGLLIRLQRESKRSVSLEDINEQAVSTDENLMNNEALTMISEFLNNSDILLGNFNATVIKLAACGKSNQEIAEILDVSLSAIYKSKKRAKALFELWIDNGRKS